MKINLSKTLKALNGNELKDSSGKCLTLKDVILNCIGFLKGTSGEQNVQIWNLSIKIYNTEGEIELSEDEFNLIEKALDSNAPSYIPIIIGQAIKMVKEEGSNLG